MKRLCTAALLAAASLFPAAHAASIDDALARISLESGSKIGAGIVVIETQRGAWLNRDGRFPMQSVYKFPIAMATLAAIDAGTLKLDEQVIVQKSELMGKTQHSPIRDAHPEGDFAISVGDLLRNAVAESDGTASDVLLRVLGGAPKVMRYLQTLGLADVQVIDTEKQLGSDNQVQYRNWATPQSAVNLLQAFYAGKGLSKQSHALLLAWMTETDTGLKRLKGRLPAGTVVAHKTGTSWTVAGLTAATNDIGIVTLPNGQHLAIAVFVTDSTAGAAAREDAIAKVARLAWDHWATL